MLHKYTRQQLYDLVWGEPLGTLSAVLD